MYIFALFLLLLILLLKKPFTLEWIAALIKLVFFSQVSSSSYNALKGLYLVSVLILFVVAFTLESVPKNVSTKYIFSTSRIWLISSIPVLFQYLLIKEMGGFQSYLLSMVTRVQSWQGYGIYLTMIKLIIPLHYLYTVSVVTKRAKLRYYLIFTVLFVIIGLLSGSRSFILWNVVFAIGFIAVRNKQFSKIKLALLALPVLAFFMITTYIRNGNDFSTDQFTAIGNYGTEGMELVFDQKSSPVLLGKTYVSAITNLVPRSIWPDKFDTGGIEFNEYYLNDKYEGLSYISPSLFGELVLNFGLQSSIILYPISILALLIIGIILARKMDILYYPILSVGMPGYFYTEFTGHTMSFVYFKLILIACLIRILKK